MHKKIEAFEKERASLLQIVAGLTAEQLNKVPPGFNNNIIWNLGHLLTTQQGICYVRAGQPSLLDEKFNLLYRPGTKPQAPISEQEIEEIKTLLLAMPKKMEEDLAKGIFVSYLPWSTRFGLELQNIEDAITFMLFHEGLHTGYIMALKKVV